MEGLESARGRRGRDPVGRAASRSVSPCSARIETPDGWVIRAFAPDAISRSRADPRGQAPGRAAAPQGRFLRGADPIGQGPARLSLEVETAHGTSSYIDAYAFGPALGPLDDYLVARGHASPALPPARRAAHQARGRRRRAVRALGAQRAARLGRRRFQPLGRTALPDAPRFDSGLWEIFVPHIGVGAVYKYELVGPDGAASAAEGRSVRLRGGAAAVDRLGRRRQRRLHLDRRRLHGQARRGRAAPQADVDLRGPSRLVAARRGRIVPHLRRTGRPAHPLRRRPRLHASRASADQRASARRILGLPADRPVRADPPLRRSRRLRALRRPRPRARASA